MKKVVVFVTSGQAEHVRGAIHRAGCGLLGNYSATLYSAQTSGALRAIDEERIEFSCDDDTYHSIVEAIEAVSPIYAPTVDSWSMETY